MINIKQLSYLRLEKVSINRMNNFELVSTLTHKGAILSYEVPTVKSYS